MAEETEAVIEASGEGPSVSESVEVDDANLLQTLSTTGFDHLKALKKELGVDAGVRGNAVHLRGAKAAVELARRVTVEILDAMGAGQQLKRGEIVRAIRMLQADDTVSLKALLHADAKIQVGRKAIAPKSPAQLHYLRAMETHDIVFGVGPAGTGKTYLAMVMAVRALLDREVKRIVLTRPAVEAGEKLGFLPGDLAEKVNPYLRPLYDALHDMLDFERVHTYMQRGVIEVAPLAFMRGRTLDDAFVVLDEAQNTTAEQMKMFLTRLGFGAKAVVTGDTSQVDLPSGMRSGLADALSLLEGVEGIAVSRFTKVDVVRHPLVQRIVEAYDRRDLHD